MEKIVIFADYGIDDAAATVSILEHSERFKQIFIVPIGGNVPVKISHRNCYTLLSYYQNLRDKITVVSTLDVAQPSEYLAKIHGGDGMGDIFEHPAEKPNFNEIGFYEFLENADGSETVLSLGPMTLVRVMLEKCGCGELVIMGGVVKTRPNYRGYEFNQGIDARAFNFCVRFDHVAITLDTCRIDKLDMRKFEISGDDLRSQILRADVRLSITRGEEGCFVWDDLAACYILFPERFEVKSEADPYGNIINNAYYISDKVYYED